MKKSNILTLIGLAFVVISFFTKTEIHTVACAIIANIYIAASWIVDDYK